MMKIYKLYRIRLANNIIISTYINQVLAENIVEAEALLEGYMIVGGEYQITVLYKNQ